MKSTGGVVNGPDRRSAAIGPAATLSGREYGRQVARVLAVTLALNLLVVACKLTAGILAGSLSLVSDAVHSSVDSLNNIVGLFVIRLASAPPDAEHPFGHHKFETLASFGIAGFLLVTAFEVASGAVRRLLRAEDTPIDITAFTLAVVVGTLAVNCAVWLYERNRARKLKSSFLLADSKHTLSDIFVSASILVGLIFIRRGTPVLDSILALVVAAVIVFAAYQIFASTIPVLVDRAPVSPAEIEALVRDIPGVESVRRVRSRGVPGLIFVDLELVVTPRDTSSAHAVTETVERRLESALGPCQVQIHVEPPSGG